jgi:hypothetical protein
MLLMFGELPIGEWPGCGETDNVNGVMQLAA